MIILVLLLSLATVGLAAAMIIPSADELLTGSIETLETVDDGHAIVEATVEMPDKTLNGTFEMWGKLNIGPNGEPAYRLEVLAASEAGMVGTTATTDGSQFWLYSPDKNSVVVGNAEEMAPLLAEKFAEYEGQWDHSGEFDPVQVDKPETPAEAVAKFLEYFTAERNGQEQVAGSEAYRLRLVPIPEQMPEEVRAAGGYLNVFVRGLDSAFVGVEYAEGLLGSGSAVASTLEINEGIDPTVFAFQIPEGTEVLTLDDVEAMLPEEGEFAGEPEFTVLAPMYLPEGSELDETAVVRGAAVERYSLADGEFYVAQGPAAAAAGLFGEGVGAATTVRGVDGMLYTDEEGERILLTWEENGITYWVGGNLSGEMALSIAESLE